jgi:hypothetical protein
MKIAEKREQMLEVVTRWDQSGLTQEAFAKENQMAVAKLRYWIRQKRDEQSGKFVEISAPVASDLIIRYANGVELHLPPQTSIAQIRNLIFL